MRNPFRRSLRSAAGDDSLDSSAVHAAATDAAQARLQRASQTSLPVAPAAVCPFEDIDVIEETANGAALDTASTERSSLPRSSLLRKTDKPLMTSSQSAYNVCANDEAAVESDGEASVRHGCLRRSRKQVRIRTSRS